MIRRILPALAAIGLLPALLAVATAASAQATSRAPATRYASLSGQPCKGASSTHTGTEHG
jgi:hypothetical protein